MSASSSPRSRRVNRRRFLQATAIASAAPMVAGATSARAAGTMQQATPAARAVVAHRVRCRFALPLHPEAGRAGPVSDVVHEPAVPVARRLDRHGARQGAGPAPLRAAPVRSPRGGRRARRLRRLHPREGVLQHHARPARPGLRPGAEGASAARRPRRSSPCTITAASTCGARRSSSPSTASTRSSPSSGSATTAGAASPSTWRGGATWWS